MNQPKSTQIYACESVSEGHPDKFCDQIVDAILDYCYEIDAKAIVACEALASNENIFITGEFCVNPMISEDQIKECVWRVMRKIGYLGDPNIKIEKTKIHVLVQPQSHELQMASVNKQNTILPNDQGIVIGYACNYFYDKCDDYMPIQMTLANYLMARANKLRREGLFVNALPDMKCQINYHYKFGKKKNIILDSILLSIQHKREYCRESFIEYIRQNIIYYALKKYTFWQQNPHPYLFINPSGEFINGGWYADTGLSGRKIVVDAYGPSVPNGGGSLSGKDMTKIDRIGNYYARYIAKNIVAAELCDEIQVEISYIISREKYAGLSINTFGTCHYIGGDEKILIIIKKVFSFSLDQMVRIMKCKKEKFVNVAKYGHYGQNAKNYPWEKLDQVTAIKKTILQIK